MSDRRARVGSTVATLMTLVSMVALLVLFPGGLVASAFFSPEVGRWVACGGLFCLPVSFLAVAVALKCLPPGEYADYARVLERYREIKGYDSTLEADAGR